MQNVSECLYSVYASLFKQGSRHAGNAAGNKCGTAECNVNTQQQFNTSQH